MSDDDIDELARRFEAGIAWLTAHDPKGSFYFWFKSGIQPHHRMPAQEEARRADYAEWFKQYQRWLAIDRKLLRLDAEAKGAA